MLTSNDKELNSLLSAALNEGVLSDKQFRQFIVLLCCKKDTWVVDVGCQDQANAAIAAKLMENVLANPKTWIKKFQVSA